MIRSSLLLTAALGCTLLQAQTYDLLIKGGYVIDPATNTARISDVAITSNKIAKVAPSIPPSQARKVIDAANRYVTPGLIDLHFHSYGYSGSIDPDKYALPAGTTTVIDAGGPGYRTIDEFRNKVVKPSKTRVLGLMNIAGNGMTGHDSEDNVADMLPDKTAEAIRRNRDIVVGIKVAHFSHPGWDAIKRAVEAGRLAQVPVMVDDKIFTNAGRTSREKLLQVMRPGDMHTHMFNDRQVEIISRFNGKVLDHAIEARKRGVLFDLGHGGGSFVWPVAMHAAKQGFWPDTISTDLHTSSIQIPQSDMPNCMSKMLLLGMSLPDAVLRSTVNPAKAISRYPEMGTLKEGAIADVAVLVMHEGVFSYNDAWGKKMLGTKKLENVLTVRNGEVVYDSGLQPRKESTEIYDMLILSANQVIAIKGSRIAKVAPSIPVRQGRVVVPAFGYTVVGKPITEGAPANIELREGKRQALVIANGKVTHDEDGLFVGDSVYAGPYSNFK
jgi:dihydroorotase